MKIRPGCMSNIEVLVTTKEFTSFCGTAHCMSISKIHPSQQSILLTLKSLHSWNNV